VPPALVILVVWLTFGGPAWDARVPIAAGGDASFYLSQSKTTLDHGWWWWNPSLGLPLEYPPLIFGQTTNVDQALVWLVGRFTSDVGLAVNITWIVMLALSAVTASWGLRRLGVSAVSAGAAGVLFALSPLALYRHIGHLSLVMYLVPLPATAAMLLASADRDSAWRRSDLVILSVGGALVGFNYIYNAFFGAALVSVGLAIGFARTRSRLLVKTGAVWLGAIVLATVLNLVPTQLAWRQHGLPLGVEHLATESEYYGLKIRHLVTPVYNHWFPPFKSWVDAETAASFSDTENRVSRLGVVAAIGWLALMATLVIPVRRDQEQAGDPVPAAARLAVVALLLATVGGFGSLWSLISPAIRGYNRIAPFIAFFTLVAVAVWIDRRTRMRPRLRAAVWAVLLVAGISDQLTPVRSLAAGAPGMARVWHELGAFVGDLEARLPAGAAVMQLPLRPYPGDPGIEKMGVYDHFLPYLVSHHLRWSYPALSGRQRDWQAALDRLPIREWPAFLAQSGFQAILIDRAAYFDRGQALADELRAAPGAPATLAESHRYIVLDLRRP
jgi:phosphoglycerol transferase